MTPQEIRNLRLKNDYDEMVNIKGAIITWKALRGTPPYVEEYELTVNIRGITGNTPDYRDTHVIKVILPAAGPYRKYYQVAGWQFAAYPAAGADHLSKKIRCTPWRRVRKMLSRSAFAGSTQSQSASLY